MRSSPCHPRATNASAGIGSAQASSSSAATGARIQAGAARQASGNATLGSGSPAPEGQHLLTAQLAPVDDALVGSLRNQVLTRDLVFEKVDDSTPGEKKEKAVYVVNPTGSAASAAEK